MLSTSPPAGPPPGAFSAAPRHYAAGILPMTWHAGEALFLVGKDLRDDTYSDFGGKCERCDRGDALNTSVREFYEETLGVLLPAKALRNRMQSHNCLCLRSRTQNGHPYFMYVVQVPFVPHLRNAFHKTLAFLKYRNVHKLYVEKTDVRWVTWPALRDDLPKRAVFAGTVDQHAALLERAAAAPGIWTALCHEHAHMHELGKPAPE